MGVDGSGGDLVVRDVVGRNVFHVDGESAFVTIGTEGNEGHIVVRNSSGGIFWEIHGDTQIAVVGGVWRVSDSAGRQSFQVDGETGVVNVGANGKGGSIRVADAAGANRIQLTGDSGDIRLLGADCAEDFDVRDASTADGGTVLVIDNGGALRVSEHAYDRRVAGVVSGAGDFRPGILLDARETEDGRRPISLMGKTFCKVDATRFPVKVGDLLTTSETPGHAMKAVDTTRAFGAVLGKALGSLHHGRGLVPILVTLQ